MTKLRTTIPIPVQLSGPEFIAFIFPHLSMPMRGPKCKLGYHRVFNLILWVLYTGMQWKCMPVPRANDRTALIHYTTIYKVFAKWANDGSLDQALIATVRHLAEQHHLDLTILHGDGNATRLPKRAGDGIGYSGHKHQTGEKIIAIVDNNGFVLAPLPVAPVTARSRYRKLFCRRFWCNLHWRSATSRKKGNVFIPVPMRRSRQWAYFYFCAVRDRG